MAVGDQSVAITKSDNETLSEFVKRGMFKTKKEMVSSLIEDFRVQDELSPQGEDLHDRE